MTLPTQNLSADLINLELLYDSTRTISYGSSAVRALFGAGVGPISAQNGQLKSSHARITALTATGTTSTFSDLSVNDCTINPITGQIYLVGQQDFNNSSGNNDDTRGLLVSLAQDGRSLTWARTFRSSAGRFNSMDAVTVDSAGSVYCVCRSVFGYNGSHLLKYSSAGQLLAQVSAIAPINSEIWYLGVAVDSASGAIYASGETLGGSGSYGGVLVKYNSDFTVAWQRRYQGLSGTTGKWAQFFHCAVDSDGSVYTVGWTTDVPNWNSYYYALLVKWDSTGGLIWERSMVNPSSSLASCRQSKIKLDNEGNVYMQGFYEDSGYSHSILTKLDSAGTILWSRKQGRTTTTNGTSQAGGLVVANNEAAIYALAESVNTLGSWNLTIVYKYDSSGNLIWQRRIGNGNISSQMNQPRGCFLDQLGYLCIAFSGYKGVGSTSLYTIGLLRLRTESDQVRVGDDFNVTHSGGVTKNMDFFTSNILESASGLTVAAQGTSAAVSDFILGAGNGSSGDTAANLLLAYA